MTRRAAVLALAAAIPVFPVTLTEAGREIVRRAVSELGPREALELRVESPAGDTGIAATLRRQIQRSLRGRSQNSGASLLVGVSRNINGPVLVAELTRNGQRSVFIEEYDSAEATVPLTLRMERLWTQPTRILDAALVPGGVLILDREQIALRDTASERAFALDVRGPRDLRGRIAVEGSQVTVYLPQSVCQGDWLPEWKLACRPESEWPQGKVTGMGNAFARPGWPDFHAEAAASDDVSVIAPVDGPARLLPGEPVDGIGSAVASIQGCDGERLVLATSPEGDSISLWQLQNGSLTRAVDPVPVQGQPRELWPDGHGGATMVLEDADRNFAAVRVTVACRR